MLWRACQLRLMPLFDDKPEFQLINNTMLCNGFIKYGNIFIFRYNCNGFIYQRISWIHQILCIPLKYRIDVPRAFGKWRYNRDRQQKRKLCKALQNIKNGGTAVNYRLPPYENRSCLLMATFNLRKITAVVYWWNYKHFHNQHLPMCRCRWFNRWLEANYQMDQIRELSRIDTRRTLIEFDMKSSDEVFNSWWSSKVYLWCWRR